MKVFKTFIKPFKAPQRSVKITFKLIFSLPPGSGWKGCKSTGDYLIVGIRITWLE